MKTLEKLKKYLSEVTKEEFNEHWDDVKVVGVNNGWLIASEAADIHNVSDAQLKIEKISHVLENTPELNMSNYDHDDVREQDQAITAISDIIG